MKNYILDMDITMSCRIEVQAENEEEAKAKAANLIEDDPMYYLRHNGCYVGHTVEDVNETEEDNSDIARAILYVRESMDGADLDILKAEAEKCYESHLIPSERVMDCDRVVELLDEYGQENGLEERWWEDEMEIDEIIAEL